MLSAATKLVNDPHPPSLKLTFETNLNDTSSNGYSATVTGSASRTTSYYKYGAASVGGFDEASWVDYSSSAGNFGSSDWTVEFWLKTTGTSSPGIVTQASGAGAANTSWGIFQGYGTANNVALYLSDGSSYFAYITTGTTVINDNSWHHIAACRSGSTAYLFLDGISQGTTNVSTTALGNGSLSVRVGGQGTGYSLPSGSYIDDVRITKNFARYTANFTPPGAI